MSCNKYVVQPTGKCIFWKIDCFGLQLCLPKKKKLQTFCTNNLNSFFFPHNCSKFVQKDYIFQIFQRYSNRLIILPKGNQCWTNWNIMNWNGLKKNQTNNPENMSDCWIDSKARTAKYNTNIKLSVWFSFSQGTALFSCDIFSAYVCLKQTSKSEVGQWICHKATVNDALYLHIK